MFTWNGSSWASDPVRNAYLSLQSTALISGCVPSINADPTLFDISSGIYFVVNAHTDPNKIMLKIIRYGGSAGNAVTNLATADATALGLDKDGNINQKATFSYERDEIRDFAVIGSLVHPTRVVISSINRFTNTPSVNVAASLYDLANIFGTANYKGSFAASPNGANLSFDISSGTQFRIGVNPNNLKDPNHIDRPAQSPVVGFIYGWTTTDGNGFKNAFAQNAIIPNVYDDGTAVQADSLPRGTVPNNRYAVHHLYYEASSQVVAVQFGRNTYASFADATANEDIDLGSDENPSLDGFMKVAYIIVKGNATTLNDPLQAQFNAGPFIRGSIGGGNFSGTTSIQKAIENSVQPQATMTDALGAFQIKSDRSSDGLSILELLNIVGATTFAVNGAGEVESSSQTITGDISVNSNATRIIRANYDNIGGAVWHVFEIQGDEKWWFGTPTGGVSPEFTITAVGGASEVVRFEHSTGDATFNKKVGVGVDPSYKLEVVDTTGASVVHINNATSDNGMYLTSQLPNNGIVSAGAKYDGANWIATATTGTVFGAQGETFQVYSHSGSTIGNPVTLVSQFSIKAGGIANFQNTPVYADDAAAGAGGLVSGDRYKTPAGVVMEKN